MGNHKSNDHVMTTKHHGAKNLKHTHVLCHFKRNLGQDEKKYGQQSNFAHIFSLKQDLVRIKQNGQSNNELVTEIMTKWEDLNVYLPLITYPTETQKRSEHDLIFTYLRALDSTYEAIRSQILASAEMPEFDSVVARIQQ
jgi:hypothetical protein